MVLSRSQISEFEEVILNVIQKEVFVVSLSKIMGDVIEEKMSVLINKYEEKITDLREEISDLKNKNLQIEKECNKKVDTLEQHSRRNNLRFFGLEEADNENVENLIVAVLSQNLNVKVSASCIDRCHRVGKKVKDGARSIIVKFASWKFKNEVFRNKSKLKGTKIRIAEDLTKRRVTEMKLLIEKFGRRSVWSVDGVLFYKDASGTHRHNL
ncbi:hypothetical protein QE152_g38045 [Popillia japonica]|uniref:Uncharacterized protein n=1 Tax=Popillia japonica TaxID=7064 RepID=A0AAW1I8B6_POPJA